MFTKNIFSLPPDAIWGWFEAEEAMYRFIGPKPILPVHIHTHTSKRCSSFSCHCAVSLYLPPYKPVLPIQQGCGTGTGTGRNRIHLETSEPEPEPYSEYGSGSEYKKMKQTTPKN
jgi:hypothetical protein